MIFDAVDETLTMSGTVWSSAVYQSRCPPLSSGNTPWSYNC